MKTKLVEVRFWYWHLVAALCYIDLDKRCESEFLCKDGQECLYVGVKRISLDLRALSG